MSRKLSRRDRYVLKFNGPDALANRKRCRAANRRDLGGRRGSDIRLAACVFECRFRGFYPASADELFRRAGLPTWWPEF